MTSAQGEDKSAQMRTKVDGKLGVLELNVDVHRNMYYQALPTASHT